MKNLKEILEDYRTVRSTTVHLVDPLAGEDFIIQPIEDVSPPKWHLGHTTWFFETFILKKFDRHYPEFHPKYGFLFNSYYQNAGERILRANRGTLSRPPISDIMNYREHVDSFMEEFLQNYFDERIAYLVELGLNHEQQHQELLITDIKYILGTNPLHPMYHEIEFSMQQSGFTMKDFLSIDEGIYEIGMKGKDFAYDNEYGRHKVYLPAYEIGSRLVTNAEYIEFIESGGYADFNLWLADGFDWVKRNEVVAPLYWKKLDGVWHSYDLTGFKPVEHNDPVSHVSYYEADAFAHWRGMRLPTEQEWETACNMLSPQIRENCNLMDTGILKPLPERGAGFEFFGDVWEWTGSAYLPYPYYKKDAGALGEYNAKFMVNQMVLRGGSCATPRSHIRPSYRNFFQTDKRWQFTGIRLARHI